MKIPTKQISSVVKKDHSSSNMTSMISTKREETPKDGNKKINFAQFYGSPEMGDKSALSLSQNNLSKKNSVKTMTNLISPTKKNQTNESNKNIYMSYDLNNLANKSAKKPFFKLDLSKRSQGQR